MNKNQRTLLAVKKGECVQIKEIHEQGDLKRRLLELGLTRGTKVRVLRVAPFQNEMAIYFRHYELCLPRSILNAIIVENEQ